MNTTSLFSEKTVFSFEIFPPKRTAPIATVYEMLDALRGLSPDFISVTYGAGGAKDKYSTVDIAADVKNVYGIESVAHLPCAGLTKAQAGELLDSLSARGIENILALRGDLTEENRYGGEFAHADEAVRFIKERGGFNIVAACYPEGHPESASIVEDIRYLKQKVDAGANQLITQLFFDNDAFYGFAERAQCAGINVPIQAGIMPVVNRNQISRMLTLSGVNMPRKFLTMMTRYENNPEALRDAGIAYAVDQIADLVSQGVAGIHLYTMNTPVTAKRIYDAVKSLVAAQ
ncbi:MAG: methylenetetrahydrofolate reductase [NAD(P)H] [Oscillospiraceae bacterium]